MVARRHDHDRRHVQQRPEGTASTCSATSLPRLAHAAGGGFPVAEPERAARRQPVRGGNGRRQWWPKELGSPASDRRAERHALRLFPGGAPARDPARRPMRVYDTGDHQISGFSQQQGGDQSLTFTSQYGLVRVADLPLATAEAAGSTPPARRPDAPSCRKRIARPPPPRLPRRPARPFPATPCSRRWSGWPSCTGRTCSATRNSRPRSGSC